MNQSFFIAAVGAHQQLMRLGVHGNNIANLNTYGFRAEKSRFASLMYDDLKGVGTATEGGYEGEDPGFEMLPSGVGAALWTTDTDFGQGPVADTGRKQDYMIEGEGFFGVVDLNTNEVTLTRNGGFMISELMRPTEETDEYGVPVQERVLYLSDAQGRFVLSETGGMIEVEDFTAKYPIGIFDYINYNGMTHQYDTLVSPVDKNGGLRRGSGKLIQGCLEQSNTDLAEEFSKMIETQRAYGLALKVVQASDEIETTINGLRS